MADAPIDEVLDAKHHGLETSSSKQGESRVDTKEMHKREYKTFGRNLSNEEYILSTNDKTEESGELNVDSSIPDQSDRQEQLDNQFDDMDGPIDETKTENKENNDAIEEQTTPSVPEMDDKNKEGEDKDR